MVATTRCGTSKGVRCPTTTIVADLLVHFYVVATPVHPTITIVADLLVHFRVVATPIHPTTTIVGCLSVQFLAAER